MYPKSFDVDKFGEIMTHLDVVVEQQSANAISLDATNLVGNYEIPPLLARSIRAPILLLRPLVALFRISRTPAIRWVPDRCTRH